MTTMQQVQKVRAVKQTAQRSVYHPVPSYVNDFHRMEQAFSLVGDQYGRVGHGESGCLPGLRYVLHHAFSTTRVIWLRCGSRMISTSTIFADTIGGLPIDQLFGEEMNSLHQTGKVAEVGALAVNSQLVKEMSFKQILTIIRTFVAIYYYAHYVESVDTLVATVHPHHAKMYIDGIGFEMLSEEERVHPTIGKPAVALKLDLATMQKRMESSRVNCAYDEFFESGALNPAQLPRDHYRWDEEQFFELFGPMLNDFSDGQMELLRAQYPHFNWQELTPTSMEVAA